MRFEPTPMPSLRELQWDVMRALLDDEPSRAAPLLAVRGIPSQHALGIYANNARTNFIESLKTSFPAIRRLVGDEYFLQTARGFHRRHPSLSGDLQPAGRYFAKYLSALHGDDEYRYLGEVARLEWLIQETLLAADHEPLDLAALARVAPDAYDDLRFQLHPSARLFASEFPCVRIWEANVRSDAEPELIDLGRGSDVALLVRSAGELKFHRLTDGEHRFLQSLQDGERFAAAVESGAGRGVPAPHGGLDGFDPAAVLRRFVTDAVIVDFK
jgi:hypothetical protein